MPLLAKRQKYAWVIALTLFLVVFTPLSAALAQTEPAPSEESSGWAAPLKYTVPGLIYTAANSGAEAAKKMIVDETGSTVAQAAGNFVGRGLISLASFSTWLGGMLLDYGINEFVLKFSEHIKKLSGTLNSLWTLVRDLCNLAFIFGFIYVGIMTILSPDSSRTKHFLSQIIIGAILINFSLYFTQVVIDFTNFTATQIYTSMGGSEDRSIAVAFRTHMGLATLWDDDPETTARLADSSASFAFYIFGALVLMVAGLTFGIAGILLIVRFIELFLIMVFSPIIFAARVFPNTKKTSDTLIKKLLTTSFFAPAYLLLVYVALTIANSLVTQPTGEDASWKGIMLKGIKNNPDAFEVVINYCLVIILLWSSLSLAKKLGNTGGDMAISLGNKARQTAQGYMGKATLGAAAAGLRSTVGRQAYKWSDSQKLKDYAATSKVGKILLTSSSAVSDASFDARNTSLLKKAGLGEGSKGGYKTLKKEVAEKESKYTKLLGTVEDDDIRVETRKKEMEEAERVLKMKKANLQKEVQAQGKLSKAAVPGSPAEAAANAAANKAQDELDGLEKAVKDSKLKYEKEKQRRIIGSTFAEETQEVKDQRLTVEAQKKSIKKHWKDYAGATTGIRDAEKAIVKAEADIAAAATATARAVAVAARDTASQARDAATKAQADARTEIENIKKQSEKDEKQLAVLLKTGSSDRGYAGTLENRGLLSSWFKGRLSAHDRAAGKEMRKTAEKGLPKDKD